MTSFVTSWNHFSNSGIDIEDFQKVKYLHEADKTIIRSRANRKKSKQLKSNGEKGDIFRP